MRKRILGSIAALAAGASAAWGQQPGPVVPAGDPPPPAAVAPAGVGQVVPAAGTGAGPAPVIKPPLAIGPPGDPQGLGPVAGFGPPPGPMYPNPGPYAAPLWQPGPSGTAGHGAGYCGAPHWWTSADYLMYFNQSQPVRFPLVTTSAPADFGLLGQPSTLILAGRNDLSYGTLSGFRVTSGFYGDANRRYGFEATGFLVGEANNRTLIETTETGLTVLSRPFIDSANLRAGTVQVVGFPSFGRGQALVDTTSRTWGMEANGLINLYRGGPESKLHFSLDFIWGYRYLELAESLTVSTQTELTLPTIFIPTFTTGPFGTVTQTGSTAVPIGARVGGVVFFNPAIITVEDSFRVTNRFNGGQVGLRGESRYGMFTSSVTGKLAIGNMHQQLQINGSTIAVDTTRGASGAFFGGLLANASNIGVYNHDEFAIIPEANVNVGLNVTRGLTAFIGYNFLYINRVARPGTQINPIVNSAAVPFSGNYGENRPIVPLNLFTQDDYWIMGVNFGFQLRY